MQKVIILIASLLLNINTQSQPASISTTISAKVLNTPANTYAYLYVRGTNQHYKTKIENNSFNFRVELPPIINNHLTKVIVAFSKESSLAWNDLIKIKNTVVFLAEEKVSLTIDLNTKNYSVKGAKNSSFNKFIELEKKYEEIEAKAEFDLKKMKQTAEDLNNRTQSNAVYFRMQLNQEKLKLINYLKDEVSMNQLFWLINDYQLSYNEILNIYDGFDSNLRLSAIGVNIDNKLKQRAKTEETQLKIGDVIPQIFLVDRDLKKFDTKMLAPGIYLIDFWASWCGPCRWEMPGISEALVKYKGKGFRVVAISIDESKEKWLQAVKQDGHQEFVHIIDQKGWKSPTISKLGILSIPANFLVNEKGVIIAKNIKGGQLAIELGKIYPQ